MIPVDGNRMRMRQIAAWLWYLGMLRPYRPVILWSRRER